MSSPWWCVERSAAAHKRLSRRRPPLRRPTRQREPCGPWAFSAKPKCAPLPSPQKIRAVIRSAGAALPTVEVAAEHDNFIRFGAAWNLADDIECVLVFFLIIDSDIEVQLRRDPVLAGGRGG